MQLKKCNALISLLACLVLFGHTIASSAWMLSSSREPLPVAPAIILLVLMLAHGLVSLFILKFHHDGYAPQHKGLHIPTIIQRATGILVLILALAHAISHIAIGTVIPFNPSYLGLMGWIQLPLSLLGMLHVAVSLSKAFISLGWVFSRRAIRSINVFGCIACALVGALAIYSTTLACLL